MSEPVERKGRDQTYRKSGASNLFHSGNKPLDIQNTLQSNYGSSESCGGLCLKISQHKKIFLRSVNIQYKVKLILGSTTDSSPHEVRLDYVPLNIYSYKV